jgi:hypothetical protein
MFGLARLLRNVCSFLHSLPKQSVFSFIPQGSGWGHLAITSSVPLNSLMVMRVEQTSAVTRAGVRVC